MPLKVLKKTESRLDAEFTEATALADRLLEGLNADSMRSKIEAVHQLGGTSHQIQALLQADLESLGFQSEYKGLFAEMGVAGLRPDFYRKLGRSGIIAEVERGKTITNNMDLLDMWKCHLCGRADFLFLIVPMERKSENGVSIKAFDQASRRLATFFEPANYVNVEAVFVFGY